jgi:Inner membrane protein YgaP-like, transmembrane domain
MTDVRNPGNPYSGGAAMRHNMGRTERLARIAAGVPIILFSLIFLNGSGVLYGVITQVTLAGLALALLGVVFFVTGLTGSCVVYSLLKLNTCRLCKDGGEHA